MDKPWTTDQYLSYWPSVLAEGQRLAHEAVRKEIAREGGKISNYKRKDITGAALALLIEKSAIFRKAKRNLRSPKRRP